MRHKRPTLFLVLGSAVLAVSQSVAAIEPIEPQRGHRGPTEAPGPDEVSLTSGGRVTFSLEGSGPERALVFRDRTFNLHEFRLRLRDGFASFDGESIAADESIFEAAIAAARTTPGDLAAASLVRMNPVFQDARRRAELLTMVQRLKSVDFGAASSLGGGRRALVNWNCILNAVGWGAAIAASWATWTAECSTGVLIAVCIAEVGALTTVTTVGASEIGRACG